MKLWRIGRCDNYSYEEFAGAVVAAETEQQARETHPSGNFETGQSHFAWRNGGWVERETDRATRYHRWVPAQDVTARLIGEAEPGTPAGVILASYTGG